MYKILLSTLFAFTFMSAPAQTNGIVKGLVTDSVGNQPLQLATVSVVSIKDTTAELVSYTTTDKKGSFSLHDLPTGVQLRILVSFVSYTPYRKLFTLKKGETLDFGNIVLSPRILNEVSIKGERDPIVMRKDTIEFAAEAFKVRPTAVVEELLKKLPGIEIDNQGLIMFNGIRVKKALVDGREFFASDIRIATKNLDAELIDKVQVYDDREDDPDHLVAQVNVKKIINLKLKKKLIKSVFGKIYGGAGTQNRFESGAFVNLFKDTLQVSLLGQSNNLSNTGFDFNDLYSMGGLDRGGSAGFRGAGTIPFLNSFGSGGIQKASSGGVNINTDYGKKLKVNLAYYYTHIDGEYDGMNNRDQLVDNITFTTHSVTKRVTGSNRHNLTISVRTRNNTSQLSYTPLFSFFDNTSGNTGATNSYSNFAPQISKSTSGDNSSGNNTQFEHSLTYNKQLKTQGSSINIDHNLSINPDNSDSYNKSDLTSYTSTLASYGQDRYSYNRNKNISGNVNVAYRLSIGKKITASIDVGEDYTQVISKASTYDFNPTTNMYDLYLLPQSTDLTRNLWKEHINPGITYNIKQNTRLVIGLTAQMLQINNQFGRGLADIDRTYIDFLPNVQFSKGDYSSGSYSISYGQSVNIPNIGDIIPYSIVFSPIYSVLGNPDLKRARQHNFSVQYNVFKRASQSSLTLSGRFSITENGVFRQRTLNTDGAETTTPINKSGTYSAGASVNFNKTFKKKNDLRVNSVTGLSLSENHNFFEVNHQEGFQDIYNISLTQRFGINWKDIITLDPAMSINQTVSAYTGVDYNNINNIGGNFGTPFTVYWPKRMNMSGTYTFIYTPLVSPGYQKSSNLLNVSIARQFLKKDRAEIKLACYDILDQAISSRRSVYESVISDSQTEIIKRYFLVTLRWKFNTSKTAEKKPLIGPMVRM